VSREVIELQEAVDEALSDVVVVDVRPDPPDDDIMPGEFDIL
jgi:hypothetical protein